MKLISCHIENFGKLSNVDFDFKSGINVVYEENGFGKSTLSTFLRVMLYGFDNETKKGELVRERTRFNPWQGGCYGGNIEIEVGDKHYLVTRTFGKKESEDFFELRNADTMLVSSDFDSNIGEQLFGIDSDSFKRSVMFSQNDCETGTTDGINAKIGNLTESTDDINNFEKVDDRFKKLISELSDSKKGGVRKKLIDEIFELETELRSKPLLESEYNSKRNILDTECEKLKELKGKSEQLDKESHAEEVNKGYYTVRLQYEKLLEEKYNLENEISKNKQQKAELERAFSNGVPSEEECELISEKINKLNTLTTQNNMQVFSFDELKEHNELAAIFEGKENPAEELDEALELLDEREALNKRISVVEEKLEGIDVDNKEYDKGKNVLGVVGAVIGLILMLIGYAAYCLKIISTAIMAPIVVIGLILAIISIIYVFISLGRKARDEKRLNYYNEVKEQYEEMNSELRKLQLELKTIISRYGISYDKYDVGRKICRMRDDYERYKKLESRNKVIVSSAASPKGIVLARELNSFFDIYDTILGSKDYLGKLYSLRTQIQFYKHMKEQDERLELLKNDILEFENNSDFMRIRESHKPNEEQDISAYTERKRALCEQVERNELVISEYKTRLDELEELLDELSDKEKMCAELKEKKAQLDCRADLYTYARAYLNEAKTTFVQRYSAPITNNFRKYFELLDGNNSSNYSFDANTNLNIYSDGKIRKPEAFSRGLRDLAGIAFRMSLTEAMFENEKPYIIMDDPFVNLDDKRINGAMKLIDYISEEYQVIYFTCSSSRLHNERAYNE